MKQGIHPEYGTVAFGDRFTGRVLTTRSTLAGRQGRVQAFERRHGRKA